MQSADGVGEPLRGGIEPVEAEDLAKELGRLRWRGLAYIDTRRKDRLEIPLLEALARRHTADDRLNRVELLRRLLQDGLKAFEESGYKEDAQFARQLFFGDRHSTVLGRELAGVWLDTTRKASKLSDDKFDDRRRDVFLTFANFLLSLDSMVAKESVDRDTDDKTGSERAEDSSAPSPPALPLSAPLDQGSPRQVRTHRGMPLLATLVMGGGILIAIIIWVILQSRHPEDTQRQSVPSTSADNSQNGSGSTATSPGRPVMTFDALGGGSSIIEVYPGVKDTPEDKRPNGTYKNGNTAGAICKVTGRSISSNTAAGERSRKSDTWIEIAGSPGAKQYAPLTYAAIAQSQLDALPNCVDAS